MRGSPYGPGESILIHAGASGVGTAAIQVYKDVDESRGLQGEENEVRGAGRGVGFPFDSAGTILFNTLLSTCINLNRASDHTSDGQRACWRSVFMSVARYSWAGGASDISAHRLVGLIPPIHQHVSNISWD